MFCPRLTHNIRLAENSMFQVCGHMINAPSFASIENLRNSAWLKNTLNRFSNNEWPDECTRCKEIENSNHQKSVREHSIEAHVKYSEIDADYLFVTGILDNVCNSACISCSNENSSYIGKLSKNVIKINNSNIFNQILADKILVFEITGGEPTFSKLYKETLMSLNHVKFVRINTNASKFMPEIETLLEKNVEVTITFSIDGVEKVFEYTRWPLKWATTLEVIQKYKNLQTKFENLKLNIWTTLSVLNVNNFSKIKEFSREVDIPMSYGLLHYPSELSVQYKNQFTIAAKHSYPEFDNLVAIGDDNSLLLNTFIKEQDNIRNISIDNFIKIKENNHGN